MMLSTMLSVTRKILIAFIITEAIKSRQEFDARLFVERVISMISIRYISSAITMHMTNLFWFLSWCLFARKSFISLFIFRTNLQIPTYRKFLCWSLRWILYTIPTHHHGRRGAFIIEYFKICLTMQLVINSLVLATWLLTI